MDHAREGSLPLPALHDGLLVVPAHHAQARELFTDPREQQATQLMSVVNRSEVLVAPGSDPERLRAAREAIAALGVEAHRPGEAIGVRAARLRGRYPISLPDAYCLATAGHTGGTVASFDCKVLRAAEAERLSITTLAGT
jgi:predicted nucleic acid-binding protein